MPTFFIDLRRDVTYLAHIEIEAADEAEALKIAEAQVVLQEGNNWDDEAARKRERRQRDRWLAKGYGVPYPYDIPEEKDLIPIDWNPEDDRAVIVAVTNYPDGVTRVMTRPAAWRQWCLDRVDQARQILALVNDEQHDNAKGALH